MKFERIDDKTVRCFLSNEELESFQIDYKDFVTRSDKAREVVREIMEQATEEVGFQPPKFAFDMSIMMMPDQGVVLTFSESDPLEEKGGNRLMEYLKEMKRSLEQLGAKTQDGAEGDRGSVSHETAPVDQGIFEFGSIAAVMELAAAVPAGLRVNSALYRMGEHYFLLLEKGAAAREKYSKLCVQALEFSGLYGAEPGKLLFLQEHGECLIPEKALRKLGAISRSKTAGKNSAGD